MPGAANDVTTSDWRVCVRAMGAVAATFMWRLVCASRVQAGGVLLSVAFAAHTALMKTMEWEMVKNMVRPARAVVSTASSQL